MYIYSILLHKYIISVQIYGFYYQYAILCNLFIQKQALTTLFWYFYADKPTYKPHNYTILKQPSL
jgi:hypothetical protein